MSNESMCGSCGHPKSHHTNGRGICSSITSNHKPCRCSRFSRPRLAADDITLTDIVQLMSRGGADHLVLELGPDLDITLTVSDEAGNCERAPGETEKMKFMSLDFNSSERPLWPLLDLRKP